MAYIIKLNNQRNTIKVNTTGPRGPAGTGLPAGGTASQILEKQSSTQGDATWVDNDSIQTLVAGTNVTIDDTDPSNPIITAKGDVDSVNGQTAAVVLDQDDVADGVTNKQYSQTEKTKLAGIETGADVTDATNVNAAGAVMNSDTTTADMGFVVDEDDMLSNSNSKTPTQQSVKAYVDNVIGEDWLEVGASADIDWGIPLLDVTVAQNWVPSLVNPPEDETGAHVTVRVTMAGSYTITWPPEIQWETGAPAPVSGEQIIVEILRRSYADVYGWIVSSTTPVASKAPGEVTGLVEHLDAHEDADSIVLADQADVDAMADLMALVGVTAYRGPRLLTWNAEVGNDATVEENPNPFFAGYTTGPAVATDPHGRRGILFTDTGRTNASDGATLIPSFGPVLTNHTIILVLGPVWTGNPVGSAVGYGTSGCALSNDHPSSPLGDDYIFDYNHSTHPSTLGARWQEAGSGTSNRVIADLRSAPPYADVYATRYDGTNWDFFRRSGRTRISRYSQANIDLNALQWAVGSTPQRVLPFKGVIHEVAIYNDNISDSDLIAVMDGLVTKWRL